jgi:RHS repeat-associated protein
MKFRAKWQLMTVFLGCILSSRTALAAPSITSISPASAPVGVPVIVEGSGFCDSQGTSTVAFNGTQAAPTSWSATSIVVSVPSGATSGPIAVTVNGQTAYSSSFTVAALPPGWLDADVGAVGLAGSSSYANGVFTVTGAGGFGGTSDAFHLVYQTLSGDGSIVTRVFPPNGGAMAGVMIRQTLDAESPNGNTLMLIPYAIQVEFNVRTAEGFATLPVNDIGVSQSYYWLEVVRTGSTLSGYASLDGVNWTLMGSETVNMVQNVDIGLVVASGQASPTLATATFDNVSVSSTVSPAPVITTLSATTGSIGSQIVITGSSFGASQSNSQVLLNDAPVTVNSWSNTSITITIPSGATSGPMVVSVGPGMNDSNSVVFTVTSQPLPSGWLDTDVGAVGIGGNSTFANGTFTVNGAGALLYGTADSFHFVYQPLSGDGSITAQVSVPSGAATEAGVMIRQGLDAASPNGATVWDVSHVEFDIRTIEDGSETYSGGIFSLSSPYWVQLVRTGDTLSSYASPDGVNWTLAGTQTVSLPTDVYMGLIVEDGGNEAVLSTATFNYVSVDSLVAPAPAIAGLSATTGTVGSQVVITGSNFGSAQGNSVVTLSGTPVTVNSWSSTSITVSIPSAAISGPMVVMVAPSMNSSNPVVFTVTSQPLPSGWLDADVGTVGIAGSSSYANGTFTVNGAGVILYGANDAFHFVYQPLSGDGTILAQVNIPAAAQTEAGVMIRQDLDSASAAGATVFYGTHVEFDARTVEDGNISYVNGIYNLSSPYWVELVRSGNSLTSYAAPDGVNWTLIGSQTVNMAPNVYVGLVVNGGGDSISLGTATFSNVSVSFNPPVATEPSITGATPNIGVPGASVIISGENFGSAQGPSTVTFNGMTATPTYWSATMIEAPVPSGATSGNIVITVGGQSSNGMPFTVSQAPNIASVSPTSGTFGASVTITGVNFGSTQGSSTVTFNGTPATPTNWSANSIVAPVPSGATTGSLVVTVSGAVSNAFPFTVLQQPSITSLSATSATIGVYITITGTNFGSTQGTSTVTFNGVGGTPASWSPTSIDVPVPVGATTGNVLVTVNRVSSNPVAITITPLSLPPVSQVQPANGATGVPENGRVIVRFAQPVQSAAVVTGVITLYQGVNNVGGTVALSNDALSVTFTPALNLAANSTFTVSVTDVTGNQTSPEFQSTFTTGSATDTTNPTVVQTSPQNNSTNVPISAPIVVQFSKAMDPATLTPQSFGVTDPVTGPVAGTVEVDATGTIASFVPQVYLAVGRTYGVGLATNLVEDSSGNYLAGGNTGFDFTTAFAADTTPPQIVATSPVNGATAVPQNALMVLAFSKPLNVISVSNGVQVQAGGQNIGGAIALSNSSQEVTFTPSGGLAANTAYTVTTTSEITDVGGLALSNPGSFTLTTGNTNDNTTPTVVSVSPTNLETEVPTNAVVQLQFSKSIDPLTVTSSTFQMTYGTNGVVSGTISVSADDLTATFTPSGPLQAFTSYYVQVSSGIMDLEGHMLSGFSGVSFTTGSTGTFSGPTVVTVSPANGVTGVPVNLRIDLAISEPVDAASVESSTVVLSTGGVQVPGTLSVSNSGTTITFMPTNLLSVSTTYTVTVSGFTDQAGNAVVPFTSTFTTGSSGTINTTNPAVVSVSPLNGTVAVPVSSAIVLTFSEPIDLTTVTYTSLPITANGSVLAGNYTLDTTGTIITFTPLSPLPGNATVSVQVTGSVTDLSGNTANGFSSSFTTGTGTDTTPPVVVSITPQSGATGMGTNALVVLTFSKSLNPSTVNTNDCAILINGNVTPISISTSADNQVVTLNPFGLPPSSTVTVLVTSGVTDLSGNALTAYQSQFTTAATLPAPTVTSQRPGNGATGVPSNTSVVIYLSEPMNTSSLQSALQISQNGTSVSGTTQVTENGQVVQFTPTTPWLPSAYVQVFLSSSAQSASGINMGNYQASFTTATNASTTPPMVIGTNPASQVNGAPTNSVLDFAFNEPIDPSLQPDTVTCFQNGIWLQTGVSVGNGGAMLQITPRYPLATNASISCLLNSGIQGTNGLSLSTFSPNAVSFNAGGSADLTAPAIVTTSPPNGWSSVGDNVNVLLQFSKPVNPLTVNSNTVLLSGGGATFIADSIAFSNGNQTAVIVPHAPLPDNTQMTLMVTGVTDVAGNIASTQTTQFTTGSGPDVVSPFVVSASPSNRAQNVPTNSIVLLQMSEPIDPGTVNSNTLTLNNDSSGQTIPGSYALSTNGLTITFVPSALLAANTSYSVGFPGAGFGTGISDLAGNSLLGTVPTLNFTTGAAASTSAPRVTAISPASGATGVPINAQMLIQFNEPVNAAQLNGVTISGVSNVSQSLTNGNQTLTLIPTVPLSPNTTYTLTVSGVQDMSGNVMTSPFTATFGTGSAADVTRATVVSETPASNSTGVSTNTAVTVTFSKAIDPLTVSSSTMLLMPTSTDIPVTGVVTSNGITATFTPYQPLDSLTQYNLSLTSGVNDLEGQDLLGGGFAYDFTTGQGTGTQQPPSISTIPGGAAGSVGSSCTIEGVYFGTSQGNSTVTFNGVPSAVTYWTDTNLSVTVPSGATSGPVVVTVNGTASNSVEFTVLAIPAAASISPTTGAAGTPVTITGNYLGDSQDTDVVYFGGIPSVPTSMSETSLTVPVPASAPSGNVSVSVAVNGYMSQTLNFTVIPTPIVSLVNPNTGVTGTPVSISGYNFGNTQGGSTVTFNGVPAASITSWGNTVITAVPPSNLTSGPVLVTVNSIPSNSNYSFTVENPSIGSVVPPAAAPGSVVTLYGSNFQPQGSQAFEVLFNGVPSPQVGCTAYYCSLENPPYSSLTAVVPNGATSGPVTVLIGSVTTNGVNFTVEAQPTITSMSPTTGPMAADGTVVPVTITGTGFGGTQSNSSIYFFGSATQPGILNWSDTSITLSVPSDAATGPVYIQVGSLSAFTPTIFTLNSVTQLADSLGDQNQYDVAAQGGLWFASSSQGPGCVTCTMRGNITNTPDAFGNVLTTTDDLGNTTTYTYDSNNDLASSSQPLNSAMTATTSYTYNSFGEVLTMTDPLGNVTTNTYDSHGNLLSVTTPQPNGNTAASVTQFQYTPNGELTQITDPNGNVTKLTYTSAGLIASITDAQNNITTYQYDSKGDRTAIIDPLNGPNYPTTFTYDAMSRLLSITYPDGSTAGFTYDIRGRRISATDQDGNTTQYSYDNADRLTAVAEANGNTTQYSYDTEDNLLSITDANGNTTQFAYNARGWVTQTTFPSTLTESYNYDLVGNLLSKTDRKGNTIQYVYDALYRLTQKVYPDQTSVEYAYDLAGKVLQVSDPTGSYGFAYDNMGRLIGTSTQYAFLPGLSYTNGYTYDAASNRKSLTAPDGSITTYGYDTLNRLNGLANSWAGSFGFSYDVLSRRTQLTRPNGVDTSYSYDALSHLLSVLHQAGSTTLDGEIYTYDAAGNRLSKNDLEADVVSNYTYDNIYQLLQVAQQNESCSPGPHGLRCRLDPGFTTTEAYTYDTVGNRLSSLSAASYNYNSSNELVSTSFGSYSYDANGNTLSDASGRSFTWDFENRLIQAVVPGTNGGTTTFKYDPFGRRIYKQSPSFTGSFLYDGSNLIETLNASGSEVASYANGGDLDQPYAELRSGTVSYYEQDAANSVTSLSNSTGALADTYTYDSYGNVTNSTGTLRNPFQYTGRELDSETGLNYNRARYYNSATGRFISEDPLSFGGGPNSYAYVGNNPTNFIDPIGLTNCVVTPLGTICTNWGPGLNWMEPQGPQPPQPPSALTPNPPPPPAAPPCSCNNWLERQGEEIDERSWAKVKSFGIGFGEGQAAEAGAEYYGLTWLEKGLPVLEWIHYGDLMYDLWEIQEEVSAKYAHCH